MTYTFDPALLESITQEARQCFLEEDAPGYLAALQQGVEQIASHGKPDFKILMRAAHSIKGGAGVAQMPGLTKLAHKLEDLLEGLNQSKVQETDRALTLLQQGVEELGFLLSQAQNVQDVQPDVALLQSLDDFNTSLATAIPGTDRDPAAGAPPISPAKIGLIKTTLQVDLEDCLTQVDTLLQSSPSQAQMLAGLTNLAEECILLGEAFSVPWLVSVVVPLADAIDQSPAAVTDLAQGDLQSYTRTLLTQIRQERQEFLHALNGGSAQPDASTPVTDSASAEDNFPLPEAVALIAASTQLRIPLKYLDQMGSTVGELITSHDRLTVQQQQLRQASQNLKRLVEQVRPVRDQVQSLYDRMLTSGTQESTAAIGEFDSLEMDRYTALHSSLQTFEELVTQIQETRVDIDLVSREFGQDLNQVRLDLDQLYNNVTQSRLVPFQTFAQRFVPQLRRLNQRCGKASELAIEGGTVSVDKVLLEQLQTPITHLLNNALDHGIELPADRAILDKPATAKIRFAAKTEGSEVVITFQDDGQGIDLSRVYQKAVERGLCPADVSMSQLRREDILSFIFQSGFSTTRQVSDISGRGVGLDIVQTQVQQLHGKLDVDTFPGQGTTFTIRLPLSLSLLSLLLCQVQQQTVAIPTDGVLEVIPYSDLAFFNLKNTGVRTEITWRDQVLPVIPLMELLPYRNLGGTPIMPKVALILNGPESPLAVTVDTIVDERQLILRSFDDTVQVPPYIAGCTILGTGEVVPVILPRYFKSLLSKLKPSAPATHIKTSRTILVAEDSTGARRSLERILSQAGFVVVANRDGQEALETLQQYAESSIDLVISDVEMPRMTGFDLLQKIRTHSYWYTLPVIMLTSRTGDRHRQKAMSLGANAYLGKPITPAELLSSIDTLLS